MVTNRSLRVKVGLGFALCLFILGIVGYYAYKSINDLEEAVAQELRTQEFLRELDDVASLILEIESGERAYVGTGVESDLKPYHSAMLRLEKEMTDVRNVVAREQQLRLYMESLETLVAARIDLARNVVEARRDRSAIAAQKISSAGESKKLTDEIRRTIMNMKVSESTILFRRSERAQQAAEQTKLIIKVSSGLALFIVTMALLIIFGEIRQRAIAERDLRRREAELQDFLDNAVDLIQRVSPEGRFLYVNHAWRKTLGYSEAEIAKMTAYDIIHPNDRERCRQLFERVMKGEPVGNIEVRMNSKDGREITLLGGASLHLEENAPAYTRGIFHDVTDRKKAEEELAAAYIELDRTRRGQLQAKDQVLSHVSHELRTPLNAIYQFVTILLDGIAGDIQPQQREYLEITLRNVKQLRTMIGDILDATRAESAKLTIESKRIAVTDPIHEIVRTLRSPAAERHIALTATTASDLPPVHADPARVRQVLTNLIHNSLKFTPDGGTVTVRADQSQADPNFVQVSVADTGRGIEPVQQQKLFQRLYQVTKEDGAARQGLGLGLYICKELVTRQGGKIWVESAEGRGSTFYFTLPIFSEDKLKTGPRSRSD